MADKRPENHQEETPDPTAELTQEQRIEKLRERIDELTDGKMTFVDGATLSGEAPTETDLAVTEAFLENIAIMEEAGWSIPAERLEEGGFELTPPDELDDEALSEKLRELLHAMALRNMFVDRTDHLSDREVYTRLVEEHLREESFMGPATPRRGFNFVIDFLGSGSDEDVELSFRYYDHDEDSRKSWMEEFPDYELPPKEKPPYDRDRFLPQPDWTPPDWDDDEESFM